MSSLNTATHKKLCWLIRHAESASNAGLVTEAHDSIPLSPLGLKQACSVATGFQSAPDVIVSTPFYRTVATATPLMERFPGIPTKVLPLHEFTFLAPARYQGTTHADRHADATAYWLRYDPDFCDGEGAESFRGFMGRVLLGIQSLREMPDSFVAVFTHGYVIKAFLWLQLNPGRGIDANFMRGFHDFHRCYAVPNATALPVAFNGEGEASIQKPFHFSEISL